MGGIEQQLPTEAVSALERGSKIDAIKCARVTYGIGLKEAKELVEQFIEQNPNVKKRMVSANVESARGWYSWLFLLAAIGLVVYYFFSGNK